MLSPGGTQAGVSDHGEQPQALAGRVLDVGWGAGGGWSPLCSSPSLPIMQEANLEKVHLALKANRSPSELDALAAQLMDDVIADCRYFLPVLNASLFTPVIVRVFISLGRDNLPPHP